MAKDKTKNTPAAAQGEGNGGIIFEVMPKDFQPPMKAQVGQWDAIVTKLCSKEHLAEYEDRFITLFRSPVDDAEPCNTRAKGVRKAGKKLGLKLVVAVRKLTGEAAGKHGDHNALLAKGELGTPVAPK